jgi:hypothetical protein
VNRLARNPLPYKDAVTRMVERLRKHWFLTLVLVAASAAAAWAAGERFSQRRWHLEGVASYTPVLMPDDMRQAYSPPSMGTVVALIRSPENLRAICNEVCPSFPFSTLESRLILKQEPGTDTITVALDIEDATAGATLINRLLDRSAARILALRRQRLIEYQPVLEKSLTACGCRLDKAQAALRKLLVSAATDSPRSELEDLAREITSLEGMLADASRTTDRLQGQYQSHLVAIAELKKNSPVSAEDQERERQREKELIRLERQRAEAQSNVDGKVKEVAVLEQLVLRRSVSRSELQKAHTELDGYRAALDEAERLLRVTRQDNQSVALSVSSPLSRKAELEGQLEGNRKEIAHLEEKLAARRQQTRDLKGLLRQTEPSEREVESLTVERQQLERQAAVVRQFLAADTGEMRVVSRAAPDVERTSTNRNKVMAAAFALSMFVGLVLFAGFTTCGRGWKLDSLVYRLGLPVLSRWNGGGRCANAANRAVALRGLAVRLRQHAPETGAAILLSPLAGGEPFEEFMGDLSRSLTLHDEEVVILDTRLDGTASRRPGVVRLDELLASKGVVARPGVLASAAVKEVVDGLRGQYTVLLLIGPTPTESVDSELLAAYAQGIVFFLDRPVTASVRALADLVAALRDVNAPLLGTVVRA